MSAAKQTLPGLGASTSKDDSRSVVEAQRSNEVVFSVVGYAGSGTSTIANSLSVLLREAGFDVAILKAREVINAWAVRNRPDLPDDGGQKPSLNAVRRLQDLGDEMRKKSTTSGSPDHAAVACGLVNEIRSERGRRTKTVVEPGKPVLPDGAQRAYVLDSIRHPAEVNLLRVLYGDAFVLIGVVCAPSKRISRLMAKFDCSRGDADRFMERDASAGEKHGQNVEEAFHLSDFFIDNTVERQVDGRSNPLWNANEDLHRLIKLITHAELIRPTLNETAMYSAFNAKMQSACLSRQVGAAIVDDFGNLLATGTNEVPRAGGGVYGEAAGDLALLKGQEDCRCALYREKFCWNTREQNTIVDELINEIPQLSKLPSDEKIVISGLMRKSRIGGLLEFSRAVHAEMDAVLSAARKGTSVVGARLFVTTFPCHYCARHIVSAGIDEVQYIEPYPKSRALHLHRDSIAIEKTVDWQPPSKGGQRVLFRPFSGVSPILYRKVFLKNRDLKDRSTGTMQFGEPEWIDGLHLPKTSYAELEAMVVEQVGRDE